MLPQEKTEAKDEAAVGVINYEGIEASEAPKGKSAPAIDTDAIAVRPAIDKLPKEG